MTPCFDDAVNEIYSRLPRATDYRRVLRERFELREPLGTQPDWAPTGIEGPRQDTFLVRLLANDGHYPSEPIIDESGLLAADEEIAWSAIFWPGVHPNDDSRTAWFTLQEVRFFGAVTVSLNPDQGRAIVHAQSSPEYLHVDLEASFEEIYNRSRSMAIRMKTEDSFIIANRRSKPQLFQYETSETTAALLDAIDRENSPIILRGLNKLLMASELYRLPHFTEEMALSAIISREAALELLRRKLSREVGKRLKKADVLALIRTRFPTGTPFVEVLETDWENRVLMTHPANKFGEFWDPMLRRGESMDTLRHAIHLYRYLLLDEIWQPS